MITEDYVSFEIAKLLKEKGFDCLCHSYFRKDNPNNLVKETCGTNWNDTPFFTSRPTLQMAMKWFREVHNIFIEISVSIDLNGNYHYHYSVLDKECKYVRKGHTDFDWDYEEAAEAAIKYCLENLI